jgi:hypothetical protein
MAVLVGKIVSVNVREDIPSWRTINIRNRNICYTYCTVYLLNIDQSTTSRIGLILVTIVRLMSFVFSSNRPVSACSFRPFISIPINSICLRNLEIIALDLSVHFIFWLLSYLLQLLSLSNNNDQLQVNPFVTRLIKQLPFLYWFNSSWYHIKSLLTQVWVVECSITLILYKTWKKIKFVYITMASVLAQWQDQYSERNMLALGITDIRDNMAVTRLSLTGTFWSTSHT